MQIEYLLPKMLRTSSVSDFELYQTLEYLHTHNEVSWVWDTG